MIIKLEIVIVNSDYCDYLRRYDNKLAYNKNEKELRPFIGILFKISKAIKRTISLAKCELQSSEKQIF